MITNLKEWNKYTSNNEGNSINSIIDNIIMPKKDDKKFKLIESFLFEENLNKFAETIVKSTAHKMNLALLDQDENKYKNALKECFSVKLGKQFVRDFIKWMKDINYIKSVNESLVNESYHKVTIGADDKENTFDIYANEGYVTLVQKNASGNRERVFINDNHVDELIKVLQNLKTYSNKPQSPKYSVGTKISQDLSDLLNLATQEIGGTNYKEFIEAFESFERKYKISLRTPPNGTALKSLNSFDWDDEKDFTDSEEDKKDIKNRWYNALN